MRPLPVIDAGAAPVAADDRERAGAEGRAGRARGAAAVLERLPRAGGRSGGSARPRPTFASRWGAGAGASPLVSGNMAPHRELCARLAELKGTEACVLFGSGFLANTGVIAALAVDGVVASDALNHASIVDGCRLARAQTRVYEHGTVPVGADVIVTDAVFCMDGDVADLVALVETGARVIVDEAHATGVIGPFRARARARARALLVRDHRRDAGQGARVLRGVRVLRRAHRRRAGQPRADDDLLDRACRRPRWARRCRRWS